jgi:hypothetical protein
MRTTLNGSRSVHAPFTVSDEQLEYWGAIYCSARRRGTFEQFLAQQLARQRAGLLPEQLMVRQRVDEYELSSKERLVLRAALRRSVLIIDNGHYVEKLRHRRWPRSRHRDFIKES